MTTINSTQENQDNESGYPAKCHHCGVDLTVEDSVARTYFNIDVALDSEDSEDCDLDTDDLVCLGHYEKDHFEPDESVDFSGGRFDCLDDSDKCGTCDGQL
jgi:hypothetical protein